MSSVPALPVAAVTDNRALEFVAVTIADQLFGIAVCEVEEVLGPQRLTRVPLGPAWIAGVLNLRGKIVTAIDTHARLALPKSTRAADDEVAVVIKHGEHSYSLIVDDVSSVLTVEPSAVLPNPPALDPVWRDSSAGIIELDDRLLVVLDVARLLHPASAQMV
jgi:purine-binding chemotaxis protein CheW